MQFLFALFFGQKRGRVVGQGVGGWSGLIPRTSEGDPPGGRHPLAFAAPWPACVAGDSPNVPWSKNASNSKVFRSGADFVSEMVAAHSELAAVL